jgi:hypothetical protein
MARCPARPGRPRKPSATGVRNARRIEDASERRRQRVKRLPPRTRGVGERSKRRCPSIGLRRARVSPFPRRTSCRLAEQTTDAGSEIGQLEEQATTLRREITNLAEAVALTKGSVTALAEKLSARQERLAAAEAASNCSRPPPRCSRSKCVASKPASEPASSSEFLDRDPEEARQILDAPMDGPMTFTPIDGPDGKQYEVTGRIATGEVLRVLSDPQRGRAGGADDPQSERPQGGASKQDDVLAIRISRVCGVRKTGALAAAAS